MPSLSDLLQFLLGQRMTGTGPFDPTVLPPTPNPFPGNSQSTGSFSDASAHSLQNSASLSVPLGSSYVPFSQSDIPPLPPPQEDVIRGAEGGILGGHPVVTGVPEDSQARGILYHYDNSGRGQIESQWNRSFEPQGPIVGRNALPVADPLWSGPLKRSQGLLADAPFPGPTPQSRLSDQSPGQPSSENQQVFQREDSQPTDVGGLGPPQATSLISPEWGDEALQPAHPKPDIYKDFNVSARLHYPESSGWPRFGFDDNQAASSPSPEGAHDWSAYLQPAQVVHASAVTGDPRIDRTTEILLDSLLEVVKEFGTSGPAGMRATIFGTHAHSGFARKVIELDLPGVGQDGVEQSWSMGRLFRYGLSDTVRTDIYLRDRSGRPIAIYDLKTGNAQLTPTRIKELQDAVGAGNIPVIELSWRDVMALQR